MSQENTIDDKSKKRQRKEGSTTNRKQFDLDDEESDNVEQFKDQIFAETQ